MPAINQPQIKRQAALRRALLGWFGKHARPLPWRKKPTPYAVWVSEIMLQQTQVATVIPYYLRFLRGFPSVRRLAGSRLEPVLELWSGLGYYRRARNLHEAARMVVKKFNGRFPADYHQARSLPGIGDYTARAILSIAFQQPCAVMDGNVARVVARLTALRGNIHQTHFRRAVEQELDGLLSRQHPGDFNQAMMELGQTICLPRAPRCPVCPCRKWCDGFRAGNPEAYPEPRPRRATELHHLATALIRRGPQMALVRGLDDGLMEDLWNFPSAFGSTRETALHNLETKVAGLWGERVKFAAPTAELRHNITHRAIRVEVYPAGIHGSTAANGVRWLPTAKLHGAAISQLARKISQAVSATQKPES